MLRISRPPRQLSPSPLPRTFWLTNQEILKNVFRYKLFQIQLFQYCRLSHDIIGNKFKQFRKYATNFCQPFTWTTSSKNPLQKTHGRDYLEVFLREEWDPQTQPKYKISPRFGRAAYEKKQNPWITFLESTASHSICVINVSKTTD